MPVRRTARWQQRVDDRILEYLRDESLARPEFLAKLDGIHATETQVRERCRVLADAELIGFLTVDRDYVEITTKGRQYLEGQVDLELYPWPRSPEVID